MNNQPDLPSVLARAQNGTHTQWDLPAPLDTMVQTEPPAALGVDDGWMSIHLRRRIGRSSAVARRGLVAVVAHGTAATSQLLQLLAERRLGVALVLDVDSLDVEVPDAVRWAATDPRVGVVVVQSPAAGRDALESALGHVEGTRAPVAVMDGSAAGNGDVREQREMHATTPAELADLALLVVSQPQLAGRQVAFVTNTPLVAHAAVNDELAQAGLLGPDLTQHAEQRSKSLSPGTQMRGAVTALASDVALRVLFDVLTTIGERGVDAVVLALVSTRVLPQRDIEAVLRNLKRAIPNAVIVTVDPHPRSPSAPVPVFTTDGAAITALGEVVHARAPEAA